MPLFGNISGSLTQTATGKSLLRAGDNVTITSSSVESNEQLITISAAAAGAAGSDTQVMFNDGGSLGGDSGMTFNKSTNTLTVENIVNDGAIAGSDSTSALQITRGGQSNIYGGTDSVLFVSGAQTSFGQLDNGTPRSAVFGGDIIASGTIRGGHVAAVGTTMLNLRGGLTTVSAGTVPFTTAQGGPGQDVTFFVSGAIGDRNNAQKGGTAAFGGDVAISGSMSIGQGLSKPTDTVLSVEGNCNGSFLAIFDNDQSSNGHVVKLLTDGNGSGTTIMEMEDGDGDTLFKARADGRFGFGSSGVSSMGAGTFVVGIDGDHSADIAISKRLQHLGDSDTFIDFPAADSIQIDAGGVNLLTMGEQSNLGQVLVLSGGGGGSPDESHYGDVNFFVSGSRGTRGTDVKGTALFGGDAALSGSLFVQDTINTQPTAGSASGGNVAIKLGSVSKTSLTVVHDYASITFENALSDNEGGGEIIRFGGGQEGAAGTLHFLHTDGTWDSTDADSTSTGGGQWLGIAMGTSPTLHGILLKGFFKVASGNVEGTAAVGQPVYVSEAAGKFDFTAPSGSGDFVRIVGYCVDIDSGDILLYFNPDPTHVEIS